jgi:tRNA(fMet)-specific endonuclease VapC
VLVLDTDHVVEVLREDAVRGGPLTSRLDASQEALAVTIISAEEQMRGWLAFIHRTTDPFRQILGYAELQVIFRFYARWDVLPFDAVAASEFASQRKSGVRVSTMDLKIASIVLVSGAKLLFAESGGLRKSTGAGC